MPLTIETFLWEPAHEPWLLKPAMSKEHSAVQHSLWQGLCGMLLQMQGPQLYDLNQQELLSTITA